MSGQACLTCPALVLGFSRIRARSRLRLSCSFGQLSKRPLSCRPRESEGVTEYFNIFAEGFSKFQSGTGQAAGFTMFQKFPIFSLSGFTSEDHETQKRPVVEHKGLFNSCRHFPV